MKNVEYITLENGIDYIIVDEIPYQDFKYLYLTNENNARDFCIRKEKGEILFGLDDENEFRYALNLIKEKNKELIEKLNLE